MRKKFKELFDVYRKLPYIIYRNKFLIPQRPARLYPNPFIGMNNNIKGSFNNILPEKINANFLQKISDPQQKDNLVVEYNKQVERMLQKFKEQVQKHKQTYLQPLKRPGKRPAALVYYRDNKQTVKKYFEYRGKKKWHDFKELGYYFNQLPQSVKIIYEQKAQKEFEQRLRQHLKNSEKYLIPDVKRVLPQFYYQNMIKNKKEDSDTPQYSDLSQSQKKRYSAICKQIKLQKQKKLITFLAERGLTLKEFNNIKSVCDKVNKVKKQLKEEKKSSRYDDDQEDDEEMHESQDYEPIDQNEQQTIQMKKQLDLKASMKSKIIKSNELKDFSFRQRSETKTSDNTSVFRPRTFDKEQYEDQQDDELDLSQLRRLAEIKKRDKD